MKPSSGREPLSLRMPKGIKSRGSRSRWTRKRRPHYKVSPALTLRRTPTVTTGVIASHLIRWRTATPSDNCHSLSDVTRILGEIQRGDPQAADELLPLVYAE